VATGRERRGGGDDDNTLRRGGGKGGDGGRDRGWGEDDEGDDDGRWSWCVPGWFPRKDQLESFTAVLWLMSSSTD